MDVIHVQQCMPDCRDPIFGFRVFVVVQAVGFIAYLFLWSWFLLNRVGTLKVLRTTARLVQIQLDISTLDNIHSVLYSDTFEIGPWYWYEMAQTPSSIGKILYVLQDNEK